MQSSYLSAATALLCSALLGCASRRDVSVDGSALGGSTSRDDVVGELPFPGAPHGGDPDKPVGPLQSLASLSDGELWAAWNSLRGDAYALDEVERFIEDGTRPACAPNELVRHGGTHLRYRSQVSVNPAFVARLERFELVAAEVAKGGIL